MIELMVTVLFEGDNDVLSVPGVVRTMYDPTAGTGGILSVAEEHLRKFNSRATLKLFGQEDEDETYAVRKADMLIRGQDPANIVNGDTLAIDKHPGQTFEYQAANPVVRRGMETGRRCGTQGTCQRRLRAFRARIARHP